MRRNSGTQANREPRAGFYTSDYKEPGITKLQHSQIFPSKSIFHVAGLCKS